MNIDPSDEEMQEFWDELGEAAIRVGVAEPIEDDYTPSKAFKEHTDTMLKENVIDGRMAAIWEFIVEYDYVTLPDLESAWLTIIGDFMVCNKTFHSARDGDWYKAMQFITTIIRTRMAEEAEVKS